MKLKRSGRKGKENKYKVWNYSSSPEMANKDLIASRYTSASDKPEITCR